VLSFILHCEVPSEVLLESEIPDELAAKKEAPLDDPM